MRCGRDAAASRDRDAVDGRETMTSPRAGMRQSGTEPAGPGPLELALFFTLCAIWGVTWIAIKTGVAALPPLLFAGTRVLAAGALILLLVRPGGMWGWLARRWGRLTVIALLVNAVTYGFIFWGVQHVTSGLSAVVNLSVMPIGLFSIGWVLGEERYVHRRLLGILIGILGLTILFWPRLVSGTQASSLLGLCAIVVGTLAYCLGSVLSRPLLRETGPLMLSGLHMLIGGLGLTVLSIATEPVGVGTFAAFLNPSVLVSWLFLVLGGAVIGFTIYLRLLRDWGPSRVGLYAFVSPIIAVAVGVMVFGEPFGPFELLGSLVMLTAAALALGKPRWRAGNQGAACCSPQSCDDDR